jgi:restriction system protein
MAAREVLAELEKRVPPTPFEQSNCPNNPGIRRFDKIVRFLTIGAVKAGWLVKSKGTWLVTEEGRQALGQFPDPEAFINRRPFHVTFAHG